MDFKGTQGEWVATEQSGTPGHCFVAQVFGHAGPVAQIEPTEDPAIATEIARLIAAAPDLLKSLEGLLSSLDEYWGSTKEANVARAAIAKALGESP